MTLVSRGKLPQNIIIVIIIIITFNIRIIIILTIIITIIIDMGSRKRLIGSLYI